MQVDINTLREVPGIGEKTIERIKRVVEGREEEYSKIKYIEGREIKDIELTKGNCLEEMNYIPDKTVDLVLCDLPYAVTQAEWDKLIPTSILWEHYKRVLKDDGIVVLFGSEPFSTRIRMSNISWYRYDWIWKKGNKTGFQFCKYQPMRQYENVMIFYKEFSRYNPQGLEKLQTPRVETPRNNGNKGNFFGGRNLKTKTVISEYTNYPVNILEYTGIPITSDRNHPTEKPVELLEYLIRTYTDEGMVVLDNTMGSGSTGVAAVNTGRKFIGIELEEEYYRIAEQRVKEALENVREN